MNASIATTAPAVAAKLRKMFLLFAIACVFCKTTQAMSNGFGSDDFNG